MIKEVAVVQYSLMFLLAVVCMAALLTIFFNTRPAVIYRKQPALALILFANFASAAAIVPFSLIWLSFSLGTIDRSINSEAVLVLSGVIATNFDIVYDCVTVGVFLQRNCYLAFPVRPMRLVNKVIVSILVVIVLIEVVLFTSLNVSTLGYQKELQQNCFSFNCVVLPRTIARLCNLVVKCVASVVNVTLGISFIVQLKRRKLQFTRHCEKKVNRFLMYTFIWRCILETVPFFVDLFATIVLRINLGVYLGAYGSQEWALDICCTSISYYLILVKKSKTSSEHS